MFEIKDVSVNYGSSRALRHLTVDIPTSSFVAILGPSGSGKSTLLRLLGFLEKPTEGEVSLTLSGRRFSWIGARPWPQLTCIFQSKFLWPHMTLRENITLPARLKSPSRASRLVGHAIEFFQMEEFVDRFPNEVSGGQAQRAALARALVLEPTTILIDEPYSGLDLEQQHALNVYLRELNKCGVGVISVSHSIEFTRKYADCVLVLESGEISDVGNIDILANPRSPFLRRVLGLV